MLTSKTRRRLLRLRQLAGLAAMGLLLVVDVTGYLVAGQSFPVAYLRVGAILVVAWIWVTARQQEANRLSLRALLLGAFSLGLTVLTRLDGSRTVEGSWGLAESFGLLLVLLVVSRRGAGPRMKPAIAAVAVAVSLLPLRSGADDVFITYALVQALCAAAVIGMGAYRRSIATNRQRTLDTVRAEQRTEFARDLHDFIAHHVTGIVVQAQGARIIAEQDPRRAMLALAQIEAAGAETMASMRRMVGVLRDPQSPPDAPLAPLATVADVRALVEQFNGSGGPVARLHTDADLAGLPVEVSTSAYRVVMESLTNARQHAAAAQVVDVWVQRTPDWLLVRVANDGFTVRDTAAHERDGYGLIGLLERVRAIGGRITAGPGIAGGWIVDAALPLNQEVPS